MILIRIVVDIGQITEVKTFVVPVQAVLQQELWSTFCPAVSDVCDQSQSTKYIYVFTLVGQIVGYSVGVE